ncbi:MAG: YHS domain-containing protein [Elusimicrobia bacterium]|nr:YHS domain-containing protein [Elusimicrobiota bacterium]
MTPAAAPQRPAAPAIPRPRAGSAGLAALLLPYALGLLVLGLIVHDRGRSGSTVYVDANEMARTATTAAAGGGAIDPVCGMSVRASGADKAVYQGRAFHFCSAYCRTAFLDKPADYAQASLTPRPSHTMRGLPTRMYQWALVVILVLSFGLMEFFAGGGRDAGPMAARWNLTAWPPLRRALASSLFPLVARAATSLLFLVVIAAGLFGNQSPAMNIAPLLTWTVWWTGLIFAVLYLGKGWCTVCPWDALAGWAERLKFRGPRGGSLGLGLPWPKSLRGIWPASALFLALTWVELGMGITLIPRATAWVALGMLGMAVASAFLFERKSFCRHACLVGRVSGLYALFSSVEVRASRETCSGCGTLDCWKGNTLGDGCPTFEYPRAMKLNTYCTMCAECFKTCPRDSMSLNLRPWASDLVVEGKPRADEAALALVLLSMTAFHGLTMTPAWVALLETTRAATGFSFTGAFTLLMAAFLILPALVYAALAMVSAAWARVERRDVALRFAYALLPIALFYHLAHNAEHFLMEGPKILALISDPFGWGWNLFGTARWAVPPLVSLEGLWRIQVLFVLVGHLYSLWITARTARRLAPECGALAVQIPMLIAMATFSWGSLWLLKQPMEMRISGM